MKIIEILIILTYSLIVIRFLYFIKKYIYFKIFKNLNSNISNLGIIFEKHVFFDLLTIKKVSTEYINVKIIVPLSILLTLVLSIHSYSSNIISTIFWVTLILFSLYFITTPKYLIVHFKLIYNSQTSDAYLKLLRNKNSDINNFAIILILKHNLSKFFSYKNDYAMLFQNIYSLTTKCTENVENIPNFNPINQYDTIFKLILNKIQESKYSKKLDLIDQLQKGHLIFCNNLKYTKYTTFTRLVEINITEVNEKTGKYIKDEILFSNNYYTESFFENIKISSRNN